MSSVCRICLAGNTRLHSVKTNLLRHFYEKLSDTKFNSEDERPRALCCFCYQTLLRCRSFSQMAHRSEKILSRLYDKGLEATHECITERNLGMQQYLSVVTLQSISIDGKAGYADSQVTIKEEQLPRIDIKEEETTEPDSLMEAESFLKNCIKSVITLQGDKSYRGNDVKLLYNIDVEQTNPDDSNMPFTIKDEPLSSIDIKEEGSTEPGKLVEVECLTQHCTKSELTNEDIAEQGNDVENNIFYINVEQTKPDDNKMSYICNSCNKIFYVKDKLISHIRKLHTLPSQYNQHTDCLQSTSKIEDEIIQNEYKLFACDLCGKEYRYKSSLVYHLGTHNGPKPVACRVCAKQFSETTILVEHMKIHLGEKPFACNVCGKQFKLKHNLRFHIRTHTGEKPFPCNVCDKTFIRKYSLLLHMRNHTGEKAFACHLCDKKFNQKSHFVVHMTTHTDEKPFVCQVCDKRFRSKGELVIHSKTHTGEKPFSCSECFKQFNRKSNLVPHMRTHTNEKPFACHVCDKRFQRKETLVEHVRCHTGEKPFVCHVCDKKFAYRTSYGSHMKIHTRNNLK